MGFEESLKKGNKGQSYVVELFNQHDINVILNEDSNKLSYFDITIPYKNASFTAEVKYDLYEQKSGNIAIEFYNPKINTPSGIGITKANFWIHVLENPARIFITRVQALKEFIVNTPPLRIIPVGGDKNASLYLYKREVIMSAAFQEINNKNLHEVMANLTGT